MKLSKVKGKRRSIQAIFDSLESRRLLTASVIAQIPTQTFEVDQTSPVIDLSQYIRDTAVPTGDTVVNFKTNLPAPYDSIPVDMTTTATPGTVANFVKYIDNGAYTNVMFHRLATGFVLQGGGYHTDGSTIPSLGDIPGESATEVYKNVTGTIAMALSNGPNTGNTNWFFNLRDNTAGNPVNLDDTSDGGPFTVFGKVFYNGLTVLQHYNTLPYVDASQQNGAWDTLPLSSSPYPNGTKLTGVPASYMLTTTPVVVPNGVTYGVSSSDSSVAAPVLNNGSLLFSAGRAGITTITISAIDLGGTKVSTSFDLQITGKVTAPTVSIADATTTAVPGAHITFPITLSNTSASDITLSYAVTAGTAPLSDVTATDSTLTIPAGSVTSSISLNVNGDSTNTAETFTLTLSNLSDNATFADATAVGTIQPQTAVVPVITNTSLPADIISSLNTKGSATISLTNTTIAAEKGIATVEVYASVDGSPTGAVLLGSVHKNINLQPSASTSVNVPIKLAPNTLTPGSYVLVARVTDPATNVAANEGPAQTVVAPKVTLTEVFAGLTIPAAVVGGGTTKGTATVTITNTGNVPAKGITSIDLSASPTGGAVGTSIAKISKNLNIAPGKSKNVIIPIKTIPNVPDGNYFLVASTTSPLDQAVTTASTATTTNIAAGFVALSAAFVIPPATPASTAVISITNTGNISETSTLTATIGIASDPAGSTLVQTGTGIIVPTKPVLKLSKAAKIKVKGFDALVSGLASGTYYYTVTLADQSGVRGTAISGPFTV